MVKTTIALLLRKATSPLGFTFYLPFKKTKVSNKWTDKGFALSKSLMIVH